MKRLACLLIAALVVLSAPNSRSCTTFTLKKGDRIVYGRNMDWYLASGLICINARGISKTAMLLPGEKSKGKPAQWVSKYGSVTFNCVGKEFPTGGMNEAGLVIDVMWLDQTRFPKADERPEVGVLQWTQYLLDTCSNVDEVLATESKIRISENDFPPQHFLLTDRSGNTTVIEYLDGKRVVHTGDNVPFTVLANTPYDQSQKFAMRHLGLGGTESIPQSGSSLDRFTRAASKVKSFSGPTKQMVDYSFDTLHYVNAGYDLKHHSTVWSIVYDVTGKKIHFKTNGNRKIRTINLARLDYSNENPGRGWLIVDSSEGDITKKAVVLSDEMNKESVTLQVTHPDVKRSVGDVTPLIDAIANYPSTCTASDAK